MKGEDFNNTVLYVFSCPLLYIDSTADIADKTKQGMKFNFIVSHTALSKVGCIGDQS